MCFRMACGLILRGVVIFCQRKKRGLWMILLEVQAFSLFGFARLAKNSCDAC